MALLALVLLAVALGASNFAAAIGIGIAGVDNRARWPVGAVLGLFESGMPIVGLGLGRSVAGRLGSAAHWIGALLLIGTGAYSLWQSLRSHDAEVQAQSMAGQKPGRLVITGLALNADNLAVGFALGAYHLGLAVAALIIGAVSVCLSLLGLELGARIGAKAGREAGKRSAASS